MTADIGPLERFFVNYSRAPRWFIARMAGWYARQVVSRSSPPNDLELERQASETKSKGIAEGRRWRRS